MTRILVPFDGSPNAMRALERAISDVQTEPDSDIQLLNVQEPIGVKETLFSASAGGMAEIRDNRERAGHALLAPAEVLLATAGVPWAAHVGIGEPARSIADHVTEYHCTEVVMGSRGMGLTSGMVLGSVATKVVHLVAVPVTLVK